MVSLRKDIYELSHDINQGLAYARERGKTLNILVKNAQEKNIEINRIGKFLVQITSVMD